MDFSWTTYLLELVHLTLQPPHEPIVWKAKRIVATCMKESKKGKGGEGKYTTLGNLEVDASPNDQGVSNKVNM
jgi:hypothetical protein